MMNDDTAPGAAPWIDPELIAAGKLLQERGLVAPDRTVASLAEVRAAQDRVGAFLGEGSVRLKDERDLSLPGPHGQVPCRLYMPDDVKNPPLLVYAHGGGFMQGSLPSWDHALRELVRQSRVAALSVDYKLSPEAKFPVAYEEMVAVTRLAAREGAGFGIDRRGSRLAATRPAAIWRSRRRWQCGTPARGRSGSSF
jgi:acetyl esterase